MRDPVRQQLAAAPDTTALIDAETNEEWTYQEYDAAVEDTAARLAALDVAAGDRVAILSETRPPFAHVFFACWRLGAVAVPLNVQLTTSELSEQLGRLDPDLVLAEPPEFDAACVASAVSAASATATAPGASETPQTAGDVPVVASGGSVADGRSLADVAGEPFEPANVSNSDDVACLFTSGTTGDPKAVRLTAGNFRAAATASAFRLGVLPGDRWLCPLSTYHMGGLSILVRSAIYGTNAVLQHSRHGFDPTATRDALATHECTAVSVVPVMLRRLLDDGLLPDSLRFVLCGGAPTPPQLVERAAARGVPVCQTYGMTEACSQVATPTPDEAVEHPETVGRPLPGVDVTLVDDAGDPVPIGDLGEIVVTGPTVTPGYLHGDDRFGPHGFHTGDVGRFDDAGRLHVRDRRADRIRSGGENVHPSEVRDVLLEHPLVRDAAVLGVSDPKWGERVAALVVADDELDAAELDADELRTYARERLASYKVPKTVAFTDDLPRTPSGTVDRGAARDALRRLTER